jgi:hypothetical protein
MLPRVNLPKNPAAVLVIGEKTLILAIQQVAL